MIRGINPSKINNLYSLLSVFLIVVEGVIVLWISKAEGSLERIIAGITGVVLFIIFLILVLNSKREHEINIPTIIDKGDIIDAAKGIIRWSDISEDQIKKETMSNNIPRMGGIDGLYTIAKPPSDWIIDELSHIEWLAEFQKMDLEIARQIYPSFIENFNKVLRLKSYKDISILPIPGKTIIDGRNYPSALEILCTPRLSILSLDKYPYPFYKERSLEYHFIINVSQLLGLGVLSIRKSPSSLVTNTNREVKIVELKQELENVFVNNEMVERVDNNIALIGIEGDLKDQLLLINYLSYPKLEESQENFDFQTLQNLIRSFQPVELVNKEKKKEMIAISDQSYIEMLESNSDKILYIELEFLLTRIKNWDLDDPKMRLEAIRLLRPFEDFAKIIDLENDDVNMLFESLDKAEKGSAEDFKNIIESIHQSSNGTISLE